MKSNWSTVTLGEVCNFENGDRGKNYPGRKALVPTGIPFINAGHIADGVIDWNGMDFIPEDRFEILGSGKIQQGDVLYCLRGSLGKFGVVDREAKGAIASSLVIVRPAETLDVNFLAYYFRSPLADEMMERFAGGAAQPNLSAKSLGQYKLPLPPLEEQQRIVAVLDEAFEGLARARAHTEANLSDAEKIAAQALDVLLEELRLKNGQVQINYIAEVKGGKRLPKGVKPSPKPTPFPYISVKDLTDDGSVCTKKVGYISAEVQQTIQRYTISSRDVYVSIAGTIGKTGIVPPELDGANLTENAAKLVLREGWSPQYVYWCTRSSTFSVQTAEQTRTAAQPKLALQRLGAIHIPNANASEQVEISEKMDALRHTRQSLISAYSAKLQDLNDLRQSLLQKAFAGELT